jgi:broad specificity phosphatase PhoE
VRHGEADHLTENWKKIILTREGYIKKMKEWEAADLTKIGIKQAKSILKTLPTRAILISSPMKRALQTVNYLNTFDKKVLYIENLKEVIKFPPLFLSKLKLSLNSWIYISIFWNIINGTLFDVIAENREIFRTLSNFEEDTIVVSHSIRIHTMILTARVIKNLRVLSYNVSLCGVSKIQKRDIRVKVKETIAVSGSV